MIDFTYYHTEMQRFNDLKFSTTVKKDVGRQPTWDESFEIDVESLEDYLILKVYNNNSDK